MRLAGLAVALSLHPALALADDLGRALYFGRAPDGPSATIAGMEQRHLTCAGCHGRNAGGGGEGGSRIPPIDGATLATSRDGRAPYDPTAFRQAVAEGRARGGRTLSLAMPRFALSTPQAEALWRYLARIEEEEMTGVSPDAVRLAIPATAATLTAAEQLHDALRHRLVARDLGLINGRRLELVLVRLDSRDEFPAAALRSAFAAVGPLLDREGRVLATLRRAGLPIVAPHGPIGDGDLSDDVVLMRASQAQVIRYLVDRAGSDALVVTDEPAGRAGTAAERVLHPDERLPPGASRLVITAGDAGFARFVAANRHLLRGLTVLLPFDRALGMPADVAALVESGADVLAARPAGDPSDVPSFAAAVAEVIERGLAGAGRNLRRTAFLKAIRTINVRAEGWPELDFRRHPATGTADVELVRVVR